MNTRLRCIAPAPSIANWPASFASWRGPASFQDRGEAYCGSRDRSIVELPTSTAKPQDKAVHDRRDARMDDVAAGRALGIGDVAAGAQTLMICRAPPRAAPRALAVAKHLRTTARWPGRKATGQLAAAPNLADTHGMLCGRVPTRGAGSSSRTWNIPPVVAILGPAHHRATKALASIASAK